MANETMPAFMREKMEKLEDAFIDKAESGINSGLSFDQTFPASEADNINYRLSPEWKTRYEEMTERAWDTTKYGKIWSADGVRTEIRQARKAALQAETDERFYESNRSVLLGMAVSGKDFSETGLHEDLRPFFEKAQLETFGYIPKEKPKPAYDPFLMGFSG